MKLTGMNTAMNTNVVATRAVAMPPIASTVALYGDLYPSSNLACTASTTTMESSTTVPITSTRAKRVIILRLNPATIRNANVPTRETMIEMVGITVERKLWRKMNTTRITRRMASKSVLITFLIEASRKSLVLIRSTISRPLGRSARIFSISASTATMISLALDPDVWEMLMVVPGCPFTRPT